MNILFCKHARCALGMLVFCLTEVTAHAQSEEEKILPPITVTASRFINDASLGLVGTTVITEEQIHASGAGNVNEAIRKIGGVFGRQNTFGTQDFSLDLRGFGVNSVNNAVIMIDGVRLSENEQTDALYSSIPIESVSRIEITRGGSSVLYGEGATGGVIQIITKRPKSRDVGIGTASLELGTFNHQEARASITKNWGQGSFDVHLSQQDTDNYRKNNSLKQENISGGAEWALSQGGRVGIRVNVARQDFRLPGALNMAEYLANPRQVEAFNTNDYGSVDSNRYTAFFEHHLNGFEFASELSLRDKVIETFNFGATTLSTGKVVQFSPRIRKVFALQDDLLNEWVMGLDISNWKRTTDSPYLPSLATQKSKAWYVRDEIKNDFARLSAGVRHEFIDKNTDGYYAISYPLNAWEIQGGIDLHPEINTFIKIGQSYRVANVDDNGLTVVPNQPLKPQISHDKELGLVLGNVNRKITATVFQHRLTDEIFYDPTVSTGGPFAGANVNLDQTQRQGLELEVSTRLNPAWSVSTYWQHVSAQFVNGPYRGRSITLTPENIVTVRVNWKSEPQQILDLGLQWVGSQLYGGDFSNTCRAHIPSFITLDSRYMRRVGAWEFALSGSNLTDRKYFSNAYGACQSGIYPDSGRQIKISAQYHFE